MTAPTMAVPSGGAEADALALKRRPLTLALLTAAYFFSYMDRQILAILQELIRKDLSLTDTQLGLVGGLAFALFYATLGIPVARLADRGNRVNIIAIALALWSVMTAVCGLAQNFWPLLAARIGVGVGEAGSSPPSHSSIAVGLPGVALAVIITLTMTEPRRGLSDPQRVADGETAGAMPTLGDGFSAIWRNAAAVHLVMGVTITSMIGYGLTAFGPSFMQRSLGMEMIQVAWIVAPVAGVMGTLSAVGGGWLANRVAKRWGLHAQAWLVLALKTVGLPLVLLFYVVSDNP